MNWLHVRRICLLKHVTIGKIQAITEETRRQGIRRKQLMDDLKEKKTVKPEIGRTLSHYVEKSPWKTLWTLRNVDSQCGRTINISPEDAGSH